MSNPNKSYFDKYFDPVVKEIDRVNVYEFENGMDYELVQLGGKIDPENIKKAQSKVLSNLKKDPAYYTNQLATESAKLVGEYGSGKKSGKFTSKEDSENVKASVSVPKEVKPTGKEANESKVVGKTEKSNVSKDKKVKTKSTSVKQMTNTPKKAKGIKSVMEMPGKEKKISLKENAEGKGIPAEQKQKLEQLVSKLKSEGKIEVAEALERLIKKGLDEAMMEPANYDKGQIIPEKSKGIPSYNELEKEYEKRKKFMKEAKKEKFSEKAYAICSKFRDNEKKYVSCKRGVDKKLEENSTEKPYTPPTDPDQEILDRLKKHMSSVTKPKPKSEGVQIKDTRKIRLTPDVVDSLKKLVKEMMFKSTANPKDIKVATKPTSQNILKSAGYTPISGTEDVK